MRITSTEQLNVQGSLCHPNVFFLECVVPIDIFVSSQSLQKGVIVAKVLPWRSYLLLI